MRESQQSVLWVREQRLAANNVIMTGDCRCGRKYTEQLLDVLRLLDSGVLVMTCRILVADDSTPIQKVIRIAFSKYAVEIATAGSLSEAIKECERTRPELVIADASLPGASMAGDFSRLLAKSQGAAMIMLMGTYDAVKETDLRGAGLETILKKPFDAIELLEASERMLPGRLKSGPAAASTPSKSESQLPPPPPAAQSAVAQGVPTFTLDEPVASRAQPEPGPVVPPKIDMAKKGRPAFDGVKPTPPSVPTPPQVPQHVPPPPTHFGSSDAPTRGHEVSVPRPPAVDLSGAASVAGVSGAVEEFVRRELPALVEKAVERYCMEHFKTIARDVLTTELRRLAEEKARYLVDQ